MGFNSAEAVEALAYDFTAHGGGAGGIPEPDHDRLREFWNAYGAFFREQRDKMQAFKDQLDAVDNKWGEQAALQGGKLDEQQQAQRDAETKAIEDDWEQGQEVAQAERVKQRVLMFAAVCNDQPSVETLTALPPRILDAFEAYLVDELSPKGSKIGMSD